MAADISVIALKNRTTFEKCIPVMYFFHLHWIIQEAFPAGEVNDIQHLCRSWLWPVLNAFAEEIWTNKDIWDWRSQMFDPVLIYVFYQAENFKQDVIQK
jgi:hypothetical protein